MKNIVSNQHGGPSNCPTDGDVFTKMLEAMTTEELTDGLNDALENTTDENYDPALIDAYLAALDRKAPMPEMPDAETSFADFKNKLALAFPAQRSKTTISKRKIQSVWRSGLIATLTAICLMSGMVVAQAAGVDIFGAIARWTDEVFSLGTIRSIGAEDGTTNTTSEDSISNLGGEWEYVSLQEALDKYGITEFSEPTWVPSGYTFDHVEINSWPDDGGFIGLYAEYSDGISCLQIEVECYQGEPNQQFQITDTPIETFTAGEFTFYLLENINNNTVAWMTEHYECYISGAIEKQALKQIVLSIYAITQ